FEFRRGEETLTQRRRQYNLTQQAISTQPGLQQRIPAGFRPEGASDRIWLAAPKTTEALYLAPTTIRPRLALHLLPGRDDSAAPSRDIVRWIGIRAAALSATYLIVNRAALELDIDPEEFDVLEPRVHGREQLRPLLHITDNLVNGAGFCEYLASAE